MSPEHHQKVSALFFELCDLAPDDCARELDRRCAGDAALRNEVEALLRQDRKLAGASLTEIVEQGADEAATQIACSDEFAPKQIGPFRILRQIGEGGMSVVYEAQQSEPVQRRVALKVIRPGMDTREIIARFESERQALAVMDHPNIAQIFDGGALDNGRPYFVMELVHGELITAFCDARRLSVSARLQLFLEVCAAIQHAHQKGVVHRDLKPSNILVTEHDGQPLVKVIDFGIAKAIDTSLTGDPMVTRLGQLVGTPGYMSPEQAQARGQDIDTRTDVYSLGVVLYQLLVGALPHDTSGLDARAIRALSHERAVPRPSTRLAQLGDGRSEAARLRATEVAALRRTLTGGLDWVVLKAMAAERERRYQSVGELAVDIRHFLAHRPVAARPPSAGYLATQFIRRNRVTVTAASLIAVALVAGIAMATVGLLRATAAERDAQRKAVTSQRTVDVLVDLFKAPDPGEALGEDVPVSQIFERGVTLIRSDLADEPQVQATLLHAIGQVYSNLGAYDKAEPLLSTALAQRLDVAPQGDADVAATLTVLGNLQRIKGDLAAARAAHERALALRRTLYGDDSLASAENLVGLGNVHVAEGDYASGETLYRQALSIYAGHGDAGVDVAEGTAGALNELAIALEDQGRLEDAEAAHRESLALRQNLRDAQHPEIATTYNNLGTVLARQGKLDAAEEAYRNALSIREAVLGPDHLRTGVTLNNLGLLLRRKGDLDAAEPLYRRSLDIRRAQWGTTPHASVATALNNLAGLMRAKGDLAAAERDYRESLEVRRAVQGDDHPHTAVTQMNLAVVLSDLGRHQEACTQMDAVEPVLAGSLPAGHWRIALAESVRGGCLAGLGRFKEAEPLLLDGFDAVRTAQGDDASYTREALGRLVSLYKAWERPDQERHYRAQLAALAQTGAGAQPD